MENLLRKYAKTAIKVGVNLQPKQFLVINSTVEAIDFTRLVVEEAYKAGAQEVYVNYSDPYLTKLDYQYADIDCLCEIPEWVVNRKAYQIERQCALISISSPNPTLLKNIDGSVIQKVQKAMSKAMAPYRYYTASSIGQWLGLCVPNITWAKLVFPNLSDEEALSKLWATIFEVCRINEHNDPIQLWHEHIQEKVKYRQKLTDYAFEKLIFKNKLGTDLEVGLVSNHQWSGAEEKTPNGIGFTPNIPTEEIFCMPHKYRVNGKVVATKPLNIRGKLCEDFYFVFKEGKVVEYDAKVNKEVLTDLLESDEGAKYLGEVALISNDSPISKMNIVFYNTLFDENASCHLALGNCYSSNIQNGASMSKEELEKAGANFSMIHCDFMFGSEDLEVIGVKSNNEKVQILKNGRFVI